MTVILVDVSDIFDFFCSGEGKGESEGVWVCFLLKMQGGWGVSQERGGCARGAGRVSAGNLGGGGLNFCAGRRNSRPVIIVMGTQSYFIFAVLRTIFNFLHAAK